MAYRPPSQSNYATMTAPPPGSFSGRSKMHQTQDNDGWITPVPRRAEPSPIAKAIAAAAESAKPKKEDFPSFGSTMNTKNTWGSTSTESMAERMRKRMQEEEEQKQMHEYKKVLKDQEKKETTSSELIMHNIISHRNIAHRFKEEGNNTYDEYEYYPDGDLDCDGYGGNNMYEARTPDYPYEEVYDNKSNYEYDE